MADTDLMEMPPATLPDDDEAEKRRRLSIGQGMPPAQPPSAPATPASTPTMPAAVPPASSRSEAFSGPSMPPAYVDPSSAWKSASVPDKPTPLAPSDQAMPAAAIPEEYRTGDLTKPTPAFSGLKDSPTMPAAPVGPATQRFEDMQSEQRPQLHGWKKALDVAGSLFKVGQGIEQQIPGTPQQFDAKQRDAALRAATEQGITGKQQELEGNAQKLAQEPAATDLNRRNVESEISARGDKDSSTLAKLGLKRDENGQVTADEESPVYKENQAKTERAAQTEKNVESYRQSMMDLNEAKTATEKAKNDPNSPAYKEAQEKLMMAQRAHDIAAQNLGLHQQEFGNKLQEQELVKPSGQTVSRGDAAGAALKLLPGLKDSIRQNAKNFGPIVGRIAKGEIALGTVDPEVQKFYAELQSFYSLQPAIHGFRNAEFVKDFNTFVGNLQTNPDSLIAGLEGLEPTLKEVEKSGRTYKPRIVEGGNKPPAGAPKTWNAKTGRYE
jgi:hypothetical protein